MRDTKDTSVLTEMTQFGMKSGKTEEFVVKTTKVYASIYGDFSTKGSVTLEVQLPVSETKKEWFALPQYVFKQNTHTVLPLHLDDRYRLVVRGCENVNINLDSAL